jgi:hypothetical protein
MKQPDKRSLVHIQPSPDAIPAPLQYYDPELQNSLNIEPFDEERFQRARVKSKKLHAAYLKEVSSLSPRLNKSTFLRFSDSRQPLFDSNLLEFSLGDSLSNAEMRCHRKTLEMVVQAEFRSFDEKILHRLTYKKIKALNVNVPSERWFEMGRKNLDSLLADELTSVDAKLMQHSFLFASGATISITFERVRWETMRNRRR